MTARASPNSRTGSTASSRRWRLSSRLLTVERPTIGVGQLRRRGMTQVRVSTAIDTRVAERAMLKHPFYRAWTEGRLPLDTLRDYARQYFHHVEAFPRAVSAVHSACPDPNGRRMLAENLAEEEGVESGKQDHATLWLMVAGGVGESEEGVSDQTRHGETHGRVDTL